MQTVIALNTASGKVGPVPAHYLTHPVLGKTLVAVDADKKSYEPEMYTPTDAAGHGKKQSNKRAVETAPVADATEDTPESENL